MSRKSQAVRLLARRAGLDLDEALVALWDAGIDDVLNPDDPVPARLLSTAYEALSITAPQELMSVSYWINHTGLDRQELSRRIAEAGIELPPNARRLPKRALRRVRAMFPMDEEGHPRDSAPQRGYEMPVCEPIKWDIVGSAPPRRFLSKDEVCSIHDVLAKDFQDSKDPISPPGVRSHDLLDSALTRPHTSFQGEIKGPPAVRVGVIGRVGVGSSRRG